MQLRSLISSIAPLNVEGSLGVEVTGIAHDARRVLPGDIYFALRRPGYDGHTEIEIAISRGAVAVVCEPSRCMRQRSTRIEVANPRLALADVSAHFYGNPGGKLRVIGVSDAAGAWRTAVLLRSILRNAGVPSGLISTLRHEVGERQLPAGPTLEASDMQRLFAEMLRAGCTTCVLELREVSLAALRGIPLDTLVLGAGDQKYWSSVMDYMNHVPSGRPSCAIFPAEGAVGREAACGVLFDALVTYGNSSAAQVSAQDLRYSIESTEGTLYIGNQSFSFCLPLIGRENLNCLLAACGAALACDLGAEAISEALQGVGKLPGSLEIVSSGRGITVFVDEARTESSLESVLRALREMSSGRILLAFGANEGTSGRQRFNMGRAAAKYADYVVLTSDNPGRESVDQICSALAQGLETAGHLNYHFQPNRAEAISELIACAQPGDVLLISGKGDRACQEFANTIVPFDDRIVAAEHLSHFVPPRRRTELQLLVTA